MDAARPVWRGAVPRAWAERGRMGCVQALRRAVYPPRRGAVGALVREGAAWEGAAWEEVAWEGVEGGVVGAARPGTAPACQRSTICSSRQKIWANSNRIRPWWRGATIPGRKGAPSGRRSSVLGDAAFIEFGWKESLPKTWQNGRFLRHGEGRTAPPGVVGEDRGFLIRGGPEG